MWNRRDWVTMGAAAVATFGVTVGLLWPGMAIAVDEKPQATTEVKTPALTLGEVSVVATLDAKDAHKVIFTLHNGGKEPASALFNATAQVTPVTNPMGRVRLMPKAVWSQAFAADIAPGETRTIEQVLPEEAFAAPNVTVPRQTAQQGENQAFVSNMLPVPGSSHLLLSGADSKQVILALLLAQGKRVEAEAAPAGAALAAPAPVLAKGTP